jgi:hypothetical protein
MLDLDDAKAEALIAQTTPVYYITGTMHSTETGAPTALMELAYRLAVDDAPYIKKIRSEVVTLITPVVEADGRDRMVDLYRWHKANPGKQYPRLVYWGHYVAHDNNRDAMALTLNLSRNVLDTYLGWHAIVLHDLHESVPFLYDNTVGDGPYNAWIDPILVNEWQQIGWNNVEQMTKLGLPGVYTHGGFDTWSPGYMMFMAAMHNGISRLYETFGNAGADTVERILSPGQYERTWYRPNPPLPKVLWSQRNNNNYEQTGLLTALDYFVQNRTTFMRNFWLKGKRSIEKPKSNGPAAYVFSADDAHKGAQAELLRVLRLQHVEISRADAPFTAQVPVLDRKKDAHDKNATAGDDKTPPQQPQQPKRVARNFPAGSFIVRMDSRIRASPTPCSIASSGRPTIRRSIPTTTPAGRSATVSASTSRACPTRACSMCRCSASTRSTRRASNRRRSASMGKCRASPSCTPGNRRRPKAGGARRSTSSA